MRLNAADQTAVGGVVPAKAAIVARGNQCLAIGQQHATGCEAGVTFSKWLNAIRAGEDFVNAAIHACRVQARTIREAGETQHTSRQRNGSGLFELHARISEIGSARSSTR